MEQNMNLGVSKHSQLLLGGIFPKEVDWANEIDLSQMLTAKHDNAVKLFHISIADRLTCLYSTGELDVEPEWQPQYPSLWWRMKVFQKFQYSSTRVRGVQRDYQPYRGIDKSQNAQYPSSHSIISIFSRRRQSCSCPFDRLQIMQINTSDKHEFRLNVAPKREPVTQNRYLCEYLSDMILDRAWCRTRKRP